MSTVFLPSIATILAREAHAQTGCVIDNSPTLGAGKIPFLAFDQGGGANIAGSNVMVGKVGGQEAFLDPAGYAKLGLPAAILPQTHRRRPHVRPRACIRAARCCAACCARRAPATRANTNGFVIPARSENDTGEQSAQPDLRHRARRRERRVRRDDRHAELRVGRQLARTGRR